MKILAETDDYLVVEKPAQMLVHPTRPTGEPTVLTLLQAERPGAFLALANRLDRETSGIVLVAKSSEAASRLGKQLMDRQVIKEYETIVHGEVNWSQTQIDAPLGRLGISESNPIYAKQGVLETGYPSKTECQLIERRNGFSRLHVRPLTGRLHQIRVHLAHIGYPVVGDKLYGVPPQVYLDIVAKKGWEPHREKLLLPRHALHATRIEFTWNETVVHYESPLDSELETWWKELK